VFAGAGVTARIFTTPRVLSVVTLVWSLATQAGRHIPLQSIRTMRRSDQIGVEIPCRSRQSI